MNLPKQSTPVDRKELVKPHTVVDISGVGKQKMMELEFDLAHGANYNDPRRFFNPATPCGCHIFSRTSKSNCFSVCPFP